MTRVRGSQARTKRNTVISEEEFQQLLDKADKIKDEFFRLRGKALLCLLRLTGKRRNEIAKLELTDFQIEGNFLNVRFVLEKKKRRFKLCQKCEAKNTVKSQFCKLCGSNIENEPILKRGKREDSLKAIPLSDPYAQPILEYLEYFRGFEPPASTLFPLSSKRVQQLRYHSRQAHEWKTTFQYSKRVKQQSVATSVQRNRSE